MTDKSTFRSWAEDYPHASREMPPINLEAFRIRKVQRANTEKMKRGKKPPIISPRRGTTTRISYERTIGERMLAEEAEALHRRTDPVECARSFLQRRGVIVFRASVVGGPADRWDVSGFDSWISDAALLAHAQRLGFTTEGTTNE